MRASRYSIAITELLLLSPAFLFMAALVVRGFQLTGYEPAHTAQRIITWYAVRPFVGLWVLLIALPLTVLVTGFATLLRQWNNEIELRRVASHVFAAVRYNFAVLLVAGATLGAGGVLTIVALHMLSD